MSESRPNYAHREPAKALETEAAPTQRVTRYVYHFHGHAKLHSNTGKPGPVVPFEVVLRQPFAIDSDDAMGLVRQDLRNHVQEAIEAQDSPYVVGDVMVRGVSFLHTILVEMHDPEGTPVRILS